MPNITRSALDALSLTNFPNNTSQQISPADLRDWLENGIDSFVTQKDSSRLENVIYENEGSALAAAATVNLALATGNYLHITGAFNGITSFGTVPAGGRFVLVFDGICTLTNSATLILPGGSDITTAAGDCAMLVSEGSGNWRMVGFFPISGGGGGGDITAVTAGTGLGGGGTSGAVTLNLADTAVTPNSYTNANITVDQQGRITAAASGTAGGLPGGSDTEVQYNNTGAFGGIPDLTYSGGFVRIKSPKIGVGAGSGHFHMHSINTSPPNGITNFITYWADASPKQVGYRFETDGFTSAFEFGATADRVYTFPDLSGTIALLANAASFSSLTSTSSVTIGTPGPTGTTGTIVLQNATNANTLTLQSGITSTSYTVTLPPAAATGAQYLQTTGAGGTLQWASGTTTGVSTVGTFSASAQTNGASISGSVITFGPASATVPGMVSTGSQTWDGNKTFQASAASAATVTINNGVNASLTNPQLLIGGGTSGVTIQYIGFGPANMVGSRDIPTIPSRSIGTKIVLYGTVGVGNADHAIGVANAVTWISAPTAAGHRTSIYGGTSELASFRNNGIYAEMAGSATQGQITIGKNNAGNFAYIDFGVLTNVRATPTTTVTSNIGKRITLFGDSHSIGVAGNETWITTNNVTGGTVSFYGAGVSNFEKIAQIFASSSTNCVFDLTGAGANTQYRINGTKVVGPRRTGWTAQTATASRADLGANPTTGQLASFCRALYDDLASAAGHGLIN